MRVTERLYDQHPDWHECRAAAAVVAHLLLSAVMRQRVDAGRREIGAAERQTAKHRPGQGAAERCGCQ